MKSDFELGKLRWQVSLANQSQVQDPHSAGIISQYVNVTPVWASIEPISTVAFLLGVQTVENQITHRITIRNTGDYLNEFSFVLRTRIRPDGSTKQETFRIHRMLEVAGRQRWIEIEAELLVSG